MPKSADGIAEHRSFTGTFIAVRDILPAPPAGFEIVVFEIDISTDIVNLLEFTGAALVYQVGLEVGNLTATRADPRGLFACGDGVVFRLTAITMGSIAKINGTYEIRPVGA